MQTHTVVSHAGVVDASRMPRSAHLALTVGSVHAVRLVVARGPGGRPARAAGHPPIAESMQALSNPAESFDRLAVLAQEASAGSGGLVVGEQVVEETAVPSL